MKYVEIIETYNSGKLIKRTANGVEITIAPNEPGVIFTHRVRMSEEDFKRAYGAVIPSGHLAVDM